MAVPSPAVRWVNLLTLPVRRLAVVDAGDYGARILLVTAVRGRGRVEAMRSVDAHEDGLTTAAELREAVRGVLRETDPEAVVLVMPAHLILRHILDVPPAGDAETRAVVEREASSIGGVSESRWTFDAARMEPFGVLANPLVAAFCRQDAIEELQAGFTENSWRVFDIRPAGDALAAAFQLARPSMGEALLVDLGALHTGVVLVAGGRVVLGTWFPSGSNAFTEALAADLGDSIDSAEAYKRARPATVAMEESPRFRLALESWRSELERTVAEWRSDHPEVAVEASSCPAYLAGGGSSQPGLSEALSLAGPRPFEAWPSVEGAGEPVGGAYATAWGATNLALGRAGLAPSLLPVEGKQYWKAQRWWRGLAVSNLWLSLAVAVAILGAILNQNRRLAAREEWRQRAERALQEAEAIRGLAEELNSRMEAFRPILERHRQTVETLEVLSVLRRQRTNDAYWYVLVADGASYAVGSNDFGVSTVMGRTGEGRVASSGSATNGPVPGRAFVAEVCLVPEGERMRQALSELVGDLKLDPLFRNVDVLPLERRRDWVATNLVFPERHFALELNLSESELLAPIVLPRLVTTNREPRAGAWGVLRGESPEPTNGERGGRGKTP